MTTRQVAMVIDLNKCIGCQACTAACKSLWTDEPGQEYMLWNNVETKPGPGYPKDWEEKGESSGWKDGAAPVRRPARRQGLRQACRSSITRRCTSRAPRSGCSAREPMEYGPNWDEDSSAPAPTPTTTTSTCRACATTAPSRRAWRPARCARSTSASRTASCWWTRTSARASALCNQACPYDKVYFNYVKRKIAEVHLLLPAARAGRRAGLRAPVPGAAALRRLPRGRRPDPQAGERVEGGAAAAPGVRHRAQRLLRAADPAAELRRRRALRRGATRACRWSTCATSSARRWTRR